MRNRFYDTDETNHFDVSPLSPWGIINQSFVTTHRHSYDNIVNKSGKEVLQLCKALGLYIGKGKTREDSLFIYIFASL